MNSRQNVKHVITWNIIKSNIVITEGPKGKTLTQNKYTGEDTWTFFCIIKLPTKTVQSFKKESHKEKNNKLKTQRYHSLQGEKNELSSQMHSMHSNFLSF